MAVKACKTEVLQDSSLYDEERYTHRQFRVIASQVVGSPVKRDTFNSWRFRLGIEADKDRCYGREEVLFLLGYLDFRAKTGGTLTQYLKWKAGTHNPAIF